ncbi:MAG: hypothetical protein WA687_07535 [Solirubrobacterales bacterium]
MVGAIVAAFVLLSGGSSSDQQRAADAEAKSQARTVQVALETYATEKEGSYVGATVAALQSIEPTIPDDLELTTTEDSYALTIPSENDNSFAIARSGVWGGVELTCQQGGVGGCPLGGEWE